MSVLLLDRKAEVIPLFSGTANLPTRLLAATSLGLSRPLHGSGYALGQPDAFGALQILFGIAAPCCRPLAVLR